MGSTVLAFQPFESTIETGFWSKLGEVKLHQLKLQEGPIPVVAHYSLNNDPHNPGFLNLEDLSLDVAHRHGTSTGRIAVGGDVYCLNTREQIGKFDRKAAVAKIAHDVWSSIVSGEAERDPSVLQRLVLLSYCDLKHYKYHYWLAFPALKPPTVFTVGAPAVRLAAYFPTASEQVLEACTEYSAAHPGYPCWILSSAVIPPICGDANTADGTSGSPGSESADSSSGGKCDSSFAALPLTGWQQAKQGGGDVFLVMSDCSNLPANPGWPLRNVLLLAATSWKVISLTVVCLRRRKGRYDEQASIVLEVALPVVPPDYVPAAVGGWEVNKRTGKVEPSMADLGPSMDPQRQAASAVDLNLNLMRWRAAPALDVGRITATKCLLLGAGTLGCSVARCLLGWGVRHITFVDNSRVAFSNPVRQSLYNFEDCLQGGKPKAAAAAEAVKKIFPGVKVEGITLSVPMPGHLIAPAEVEKVGQHISTLELLVSQHDVIFLLTDTRESRWLPTLLAAAAGKLAINSALGFDGFMVMRHGASPPLVAVTAQAQHAEHADRGQFGEQQAGQGQQTQQESVQAQQKQLDISSSEGRRGEEGGKGRELLAAHSANTSFRLGCYFCNDVVAPVNSTVDRSMDQQCTVARPGLSAIAGSLAVELMAAVLAHPLGADAPPAGTPASRQLAEEVELPLGEVPHMVRGQLGGFSQMCLSGQAFPQCTACSEAVLLRYKEEGHAFLLKGLQNPGYLEDLTGLTELHQASEVAVEGWDSEEEGDSGGTNSAALVGKRETGKDEDAWEEL